MSRRTTMPAPWATAAAKAGGVAQLAKALGVGTATIWRWSAGANVPVAVTKNAVAMWFKRRGLADPWTGTAGVPASKESTTSGSIPT